jgi:dTMP kinase
MSEKNKPQLFSVSGIDGSGKTSVIDILVKDLNESNIKTAVFKNHEPFSNYWNVIKKIKGQCASHGKEFPYATDRFLQALELAMRCEEELPKLLQENEIVFSDRYVLDKIVYGALNGDIGDLARVTLYSLRPNPKITFYLDISPVIARKRLDKRGPPYEIKENLELLTKAKDLFETELTRYPHKIIRVNAEQEVQKVAADIKKHIYSSQ